MPEDCSNKEQVLFNEKTEGLITVQAMETAPHCSVSNNSSSHQTWVRVVSAEFEKYCSE